MRSAGRMPWHPVSGKSVDYAAVRSGPNARLRITADTASSAVCGAPHTAQFERSIIRERTNAGLAASLARGRKGGRKQRVTSDDIGAAIALLGDPKISVRKAAKRLGISVSTLYRHAPGLRSRAGGGGPSTKKVGRRSVEP